MKRGFSLVELSIVLVILGLLVGGVLSGQALIHAAQLRAVYTEASKYRTAVQTFRGKYFAYPGDMTNATSFWGSIAGSSADNYTTSCYSTLTPDIRTCNGNGDGQIPGTSGTGEMWHAWVQLANAGLIEGSYTGGQIPWAAPYYVPGTNVGASKFAGNAGWLLMAMPTVSGTPRLFASNPGLYLTHFIASGGAGPSMLPEDAWNVDTKLDDGMPATGWIIASKGSVGGCTSRGGQPYDPTLDPLATYSLTVTTVSCQLQFEHL